MVQLCLGATNYEPCDIYNADETGIYYCALPDSTLSFLTDKLSGSKRAKSRITVLVTANMDGSDKHPLLVIGKSKEPCYVGEFHNYQFPTPTALMLG